MSNLQRRPTIALVLFTWLVFQIGCDSSPNAAVRVPAPASATTPADVSDTSVTKSPASSSTDIEASQSEEQDTTTDSAADNSDENESDENASNTSQSTDTVSAENASEESGETKEAAPVPAERIMLLSDSGPILLDLRITIDGKPYRESFSSVIEEVMAIADDDKDGIVTWEDIMAHPRFMKGQFGNPASTTYQAQQDMIRQYDTTKNGRVDPGELVRYISSGQSTSQAFALYTSNYRRNQNRDRSPIRKWLDVNDDLVLDADEIKDATNRLRLSDINDDDVLLAADFTEPTNTPGMAMQRRRRDDDYLPKVGWQLRANDQWSDVRVAWNEFFALGQDVQPNDLDVMSGIFNKLDLDASGFLDSIEMEMLVEIEPHIELDIELASNDGKPPEVKLGALRISADDIDALVQHQPNRITLKLAKTSIDIFVNDTVGAQRFDQQAQNFLQQADADKNEYLDEDEFSSVGQFFNADFATVDLDGNKMVVVEEMTSILEQRQIVTRNQVSVRADDQDDALLPSIDLNSDGRIDSREIASAPETLLSLDRNEDGELALHELQGSMMIGIARGGNRGAINPGDATFRVPQVIRDASESTPVWFKGMDRNRDQGISWREFVGTKDQFQQLDSDEDGFIVVDEIPTE